MSEHWRDKLSSAIFMGGNEIHLHFLAETKEQRFEIESDLRNAHPTPLNKQYAGILALFSGTWKPE
jgi:hypothetical protein